MTALDDLAEIHRPTFAEAPTDAQRQVHGPCHPAGVFSGEPIFADIAVLPDGETRRVPVWRISPMGVDLIIETQRPAVGARVALCLHIGDQTCNFGDSNVTAHYEHWDLPIIGVRWAVEPSQGSSAGTSTLERRARKRWTGNSDLAPTGAADNPARLDDRIFFRVDDVSASGLGISTSMRNKMLVPGMRLHARIAFPGSDLLDIELRLVSVSPQPGANHRLRVGSVFATPTEALREAVGQYVLQFGPRTTPEELRREGLLIRSAASAVVFDLARSVKEYRQVLALRHEAYSLAGKVPGTIQPAQMYDFFDHRAKILVARYRGEVVASLRLVFLEPDNRIELDSLVELPGSLPDRRELVEVSRVCTDPSCRQSDLLYALFRHASLLILEARRRWIISSATTRLLPLYEKLGAKSISVTYEHPELRGGKHHVFLLDAHAALAGEAVGPIVWNSLLSDVSQFAASHSLVRFSAAERIRVRWYGALSPVTRLLVAAFRWRSRRATRRASRPR